MIQQTKIKLDELLLPDIPPETVDISLSDIESNIETIRDSMLTIRRSRNIESVAQSLDEARTLLSVVESSFKTLRLANPDRSPVKVNNKHLFTDPNKGRHTATLIAYCISLTARVFSGASQRATSFLLKALQLFGLSIALLSGGPNLQQQKTLHDIPDSVTTLENQLNLGITSLPYAVCPTCCCLYKPSYTLGSANPDYPSVCTRRPMPSSEPCGAEILQQGKPIKTFHYYSFLEWFGKFVALPEIEELGDRFCEAVEKSPIAPEDKSSFQDGSFIWELPAPNGSSFLMARGDEGRWLFKLHADFFNTKGMRIRGRSSSTGVMSLTCLNLPLKMANDPAYIYVPGLIQGPHEPPIKEAGHSHFLDPLVDELEIAYTRGVKPYATYRTHLTGHPYQRTFRIAVALAVMDFKAARPFGGFLDVTSHMFCFTCQCWHKTQLGNTDIEQWKPASDEFLRQGSNLWRNAEKTGDKSSIVGFYGTRYTALWRLPYWTPTRQLVVDPMHTFFLILQQRYFRNALELENPADSSKKPAQCFTAFRHPFIPPPHPSTVTPLGNEPSGMTYHSAYAVGSIHRVLSQPTTNDRTGRRTLTRTLLSFTKDALTYVCIDLNLLPNVNPIQQAHLVAQLVEWRMQMPLDEMESVPIDSVALLARLQEVVRNAITPAWMSKPPVDVGLPSAGTLKADIWRTLFFKEMEDVLKTSMFLSCASIMMTKNKLTVDRRETFRTCLKQHVLGLKQNFPAFLLPSHHLAFHVFDSMEAFGPVRYTWGFPHELLIGKLQRIPTNHTIGERERTILHSFHKGASFRQWLLRPDCPPLLQFCRDLLDKAYNYNSRAAVSIEHSQDASGEADADRYTMDMETLDDNGPGNDAIYEPLADIIPSEVFRLAASTTGIECFTRVSAPYGFYAIASSVAVGNSFVCFRPVGDRTGDWIPGQIHHIFKKDGKFVMAIRRSKVLPREINEDPFSSFWDYGFEAKMVSALFSEKLEVVEMSRIVAHTARLQINHKAAVVLNLCRVRYLYVLTSAAMNDAKTCILLSQQE
ncbi:hypothetical protein K435DRAFT_666729 [Dendrothele bispora CBS 962.96]|uniref:Transposase family Tnp2 protein n=1 Tax=Dendrothele bispora (strain CBS 962.96) TaxID=1314807 RepID=A0A4S8LZT8_DENBC|nr:hypothetical protein K435DRAFT_666729 [Dendrothele bispora CBS 962.96]